jgi:tetraacyldisaccharide 4'-kinase
MLKARITEIMTRREPYPFCSLATFLGWISVLYGGLVRFRRRLYARGTLTSYRLPCPVISVGNLTVGGTGKTPMAVHLVEAILKLGYRPVILSRGYKGLGEKGGAVVSDGHRLFCSARQAGDEPYLMAALLPSVPVVVGRNRYRIGLDAVQKFKPDLVVLDDAYQHLQLKRDLNLLLLDARHPFGNDHLLPRGTLREPAAFLHSADAVVLTRAGQVPLENRESLIRWASPRPVFASDHQPVVRMVLEAGQPAGALQAGPEEGLDLKDRRIFAFAGLGRNDAFFNSLGLLGASVQGTKGFADHYFYTDGDLRQIVQLAPQAGASCLITTDKDFVRLPPGTRLPFDLIVMGVRMNFGLQQMAWGGYIARTVKRLVEK